MSKKLPKIKNPIFETTLPTTGEKVKYHGFTVKEEKMMLIAKESDDINDALNAIHQVITNCVPDINADDLPMVDLTWLLIALRSKSVNDKMKLVITDDETQEQIEAEIDLANTSVIKSDVDKSKIDVDGTVLFLKYPGYKSFKQFMNDPENPQMQYEILKDSLLKIATEDELYYFKDFTDEEIQEFVDDLPDHIPEKIKEFWENVPILRHEIDYKRPSDGKERKFVIEEFSTFFI